MCGEKTVIHKNDRIAQGSPPRVRGKVLGTGKGCDGVGITPAYAGKRCVYSAQNQSLRDHPRVCGEKTKLDKRNVATKGSPPRMRGKVSNVQSLANRSGITPACAGKRRPVPSPRSTRQDHPRVCGEKPPKGCGLNLILGSPPRVRGKAAAARAGLVAVGITPACAGKSVFRRSFTSDSGGSPPRVRGKVRPHEKQRDRYGITPACAGKRRFWSRRDTLD